MKTLIINGNRFSLESESHAFLTSYMKRLETYIIAHRLDKQLYDDVLSGIEEKLGAIDGDISQKHCVDIVNALGEPEDIFEGEEASDTPLTTTSKRKYGLWVKAGIAALVLVGFFGLFGMLMNSRAPAPVVIVMLGLFVLFVRYVINYKTL